jgi:hypothetical protein
MKKSPDFRGILFCALGHKHALPLARSAKAANHQRGFRALGQKMTYLHNPNSLSAFPAKISRYSASVSPSPLNFRMVFAVLSHGQSLASRILSAPCLRMMRNTCSSVIVRALSEVSR